MNYVKMNKKSYSYKLYYCPVDENGIALDLKDHTKLDIYTSMHLQMKCALSDIIKNIHA